MIKKAFKFLLRGIIIICVILFASDIIFSFVRYHKYYQLKEVKHPLLGSNHQDYVIGTLDTLNYRTKNFIGKVKLLYWHTGCPASTLWIPRINHLAKTYPDALEIFIITDQAKASLKGFSKAPNFHVVSGSVRWNEPCFKHTSSSHLVILDQHNDLRAYGYQLGETDTIIKSLVAGSEITPGVRKSLLLAENEMQSSLKNVNNFKFEVSGYNPRYSSSARSSSNLIDYKNLSISNIYGHAFDIPQYRVLDKTARDIKSEEKPDLYSVYYKTRSSFRPIIWKLIFDDRTKQREKFLGDLKYRLDEAFGLRTEIKLRETQTLFLGTIGATSKNELKVVPRDATHSFKIKLGDSDTTFWRYFIEGNLDFIARTIEQRIQIPVITSHPNSKEYCVKLNILNKSKYSGEEIIANLEDQGLRFTIKNAPIQYLEIEE